jgi:CRISPR/Cas system CMR subunit Cmr4 (Cas7 group RAMP superfamily)
MMNDTIYLARLTVEAASPLSIGSGRRGITTDRLVVRNAYGLPYLPGTSLAGCLRSALTETADPRIVDDLFGSLATNGGTGSRVVLSSGHLIGSDGKVVGESTGIPSFKDDYLSSLTEGWLPERDHVRINSRGVADAEGHGKFDEQLVPRGVRFVFDLSLTGTINDKKDWDVLLQQFSLPFFRIGGGTRKGFGKLSVIEIKQCILDLRQADQRSAYLDLSTALDIPLPPAFTTSSAPADAPKNDAWLTYELRLKARDYFQFGQGVGGEAKDGSANAKGEKGWVNQLTKQEPTVQWNNGKPQLLNGDEAHYILPATSVKGALSHRTAYHYNRLRKKYVEDQKTNVPSPDYGKIVTELLGESHRKLTDQESIQQELDRLTQLQKSISDVVLDDSPAFKEYATDLKAAQTDEAKPNVGENNDAVRALFGFAVQRDEKDKPRRGRVLIDDVFLPASKVKTRTFSHVMIDRFTGGAKAGALFNEEVASTEEDIPFTIHVQKAAFAGNDKAIQAAFEEALLDLANGQLPLGGSVAKGHGIFTGELIAPATQQA